MKLDPVQEIVQFIENAQRQYYNDGSSNLSDAEYDSLYKQLEQLDPDNPLLSQVEPYCDSSHWIKERHEYPLGSLSKCNTFDQFAEWAFWASRSNILIIQEKLDGMSICLKYENGNLISAVSRGTGLIGEDIYRNVKNMKNVPSKISFKDSLYVRGEIILKHSDFKRLPSDENFKNPRNAATGIAKRLDGKYCDFLSVKAYEVLNCRDFNIDTEIKSIELLKNLGFDVVETIVSSSIEAANSVYDEYVKTKRNELDWDIDGLVVKNNPIRNEGDDWKKPKNKIAWKFPHQYTSTIIKNIEWSLNNSHITPVAIFEPVDLGGITIGRASLHNVRFIQEKGIGIGAKVEISRRNDVIPYVESVLVPSTQAFQIVKECPMCGGNVEYAKNMSGRELQFLVCMNPLCKAKTVSLINSWMISHESRGVASSTIESLYEELSIDTLPKFLSISDGGYDRAILALDGFGQRKLDIIKAEIQKTRNTTLLKFIDGIGISGFSKRSFEKILDHLKDYDFISLTDFIVFCLDTNNIQNIEGFAAESANALSSEINCRLSLIKELEKLVVVTGKEKRKLISDKLKGISFCFTGSLETMGRKAAEEKVKNVGGEIKGVNKTLTYLVTNDTTSGSSKNKKAKELGVKIIDEKQFLDLIA